MRRHSTWFLLVATIVISALVVENEVTAAPAPAPEPCGFDIGFGILPRPFRKPKEDKEKDKKEKDKKDKDKKDKDKKDKDKKENVKKAEDNLFDDFRKFLELL